MPLLGAVTLAQRAFDTHFPRPKDLFVVRRHRRRRHLARRRRRSTRRSTRIPTRWCARPAPGSTERAGGIDMILNIFYVLLALSIVVSLFGMVNALALSVFERTRELGMLRAIGLTRRQTRRMIRYESVIIALIGAALGLPLGILLAAVITKALDSMDVTFSLPVVADRRVRDRGDAGGHAGGHPARAPGVAAERAEGAAVRVDGHPIASCRPQGASLRPARAGARPARDRPDRPPRRGRLVRPAPAGDVGDRPPRRRPGAAGRCWGWPRPCYPRLRAGWRAVLALLLGVFGLGTASEAWYYIREVGASGDDYTGLLAIPAGLMLARRWASSRSGGPGAWTMRMPWRYLRRTLLGVAGLIVSMVVVYPLVSSYGQTHIGRAVVPAPKLGADFEEVSFTTDDGLRAPGLVRAIEEPRRRDRFPRPQGPAEADQDARAARLRRAAVRPARRGRQRGRPERSRLERRPGHQGGDRLPARAARRRSRSHRRNRPLGRRRADARDGRRNRRSSRRSSPTARGFGPCARPRSARWERSAAFRSGPASPPRPRSSQTTHRRRT